jgi:hypothetical protein
MDISFCLTWLNGPGDYNQGIEFYQMHGQNNALKKLFATGPTLFNKKKLRSEIEAISKNIPAAEGIVLEKSKIDKAKLPEHLQIEFNKLHGLIQTISHQHSRLDLIQNTEDRYQACKLIIAAVEERRSIFQRIDHFNATGHDLIKKEIRKPEVNKELSADPELRKFQLKEELRLARSQRSKLKNKPTRIAAYNAIVKRIQEIEIEIS